MLQEIRIISHGPFCLLSRVHDKDSLLDLPLWPDRKRFKDLFFFNINIFFNSIYIIYFFTSSNHHKNTKVSYGLHEK
jgi:hypothetical protein